MKLVLRFPRGRYWLILNPSFRSKRGWVRNLVEGNFLLACENMPSNGTEVISLRKKEYDRISHLIRENREWKEIYKEVDKVRARHEKFFLKEWWSVPQYFTIPKYQGCPLEGKEK